MPDLPDSERRRLDDASQLGADQASAHPNAYACWRVVARLVDSLVHEELLSDPVGGNGGDE